MTFPNFEYLAPISKLKKNGETRATRSIAASVASLSKAASAVLRSAQLFKKLSRHEGVF
jgi:hypothetical protein